MIAGYDRGRYIVFGWAMDYPERVKRLAVPDGMPIIEALDRCNVSFVQAWRHWLFFAQPEKPERAIIAGRLAWYGVTPGAMEPKNYEDFRPL